MSNQEKIVAKAVWPFDLFPNYVVLEGKTLHFVYRKFFNLSEKLTWQIADLLAVEIHQGPIFASLVFSNRYFTDQHRHLNWLFKEDAVRLRNRVNELIVEVKKQQGAG